MQASTASLIVDDTASGSLLTTACSLASRSFVVQQSSFGARVAVLLAPLSSVLPAFVCLYRPFLPPFLLSIRMMPIQGYIKPLRSTGMLANKSISAIFSNVETLLKYAAPLSLGSVRHELFTVIRHAHAASTSPSWRASIDVLATGATTRSSAISSWSWYARRRAFHDRWRTAARRSKPLVRY